MTEDESKEPGRVIPMKRKGRPAGDRGPSKAEISQRITDIMLGDCPHLGINGAFPFHRKFEVYLDDWNRERVPVEVDPDDVCRIVKDSVITDAIYQYAQSNRFQCEHYTLTKTQCKDIMHRWKANAEPLKSKPKSVLALSESGYCFSRLPFDPCLGATPTWDNLFSRFTNQAAFRQWIGSLFFEESYRQQYVFCYGEGNDGKGSIGRWLGRIFGQACSTRHEFDKKDRWLVSSIMSSRVVIGADVDNSSIVTSGFLKHLTGGDALFAEFKGQNGYNVTPNFKLLFFSNNLPKISSRKSEIRRLIFVQASPTEFVFDPHFEDKLWDESAAFIGRCKAEYLAANPKHGPIAIEECEELDSWIDEVEAPFTNFVERTLQFDPSFKCRARDMRYALSQVFKDDHMQLKFLQWLREKHKIRKQTIRFDGEDRTYKGYIGVRMADASFRDKDCQIYP